ncbi:ABC transporter substrate-binding protein [Paenibacillus hamazuiensis]|uniref:ABC transporter substrate-binding protein n=1 Tax=Paenibacillus hamazuiensis TaxID=2936508 RepID=UPI00200E014D|nr:extracellular solute-binding protein [Paenibacillus hamazuiensis]
MRKQNSRVWITLLAAFMLTASVLAGCSGGDTKPSGAAASGDSKGQEAGSPENMKATIKVWDWDETFQKTMIPEFNKKYPNIKVEYTVVNPNDYLQKLQSGIASGSDVPDVILSEMAYRGKLFDLDVLDNIEKAPYNFKRAELFDYLIPLLTNSKGELVGVDQQITPAGLAYRRDLAKQYLGTDDPAQLEKMFPDWNAFIAKGVEVKEKSGGKVTMFAGLGDAFGVLRGQNAMEYIKGKEIDLTKRMKSPLETLFQMRNAGILGKLEMNSPAWSSSLAKGENIFYGMAPWGPKWNISANDKEGKGRWGLVKAPGGGFTLGGTAVSVYKDSKQKQAAWAFINFCYVSDEGTKIALEKFGFTPGVKSFYAKNADLINKGSEFDAFFGGQNLTKYFVEKIVPDLKGQAQTKYESIVDSAFKTLYPLWTQDTGIDADKALEKFKAEVKNKASDATVK